MVFNVQSNVFIWASLQEKRFANDFLADSTVQYLSNTLCYVISLRLSETQQIDKDGEQKGKRCLEGRKKEAFTRGSS